MSAIECEDGEGVPTLRLTDEGLETPEHLVGATGVITIEKPDLKMGATFRGDGVPEYSELTVFPPTNPDNEQFCPEGCVRINGKLYEVIDDRDLNECPHCGSDSVDATGDPPKCYDCETELEGR